MKNNSLIIAFLICTLIGITAYRLKQQNPWKESQIMEPSELMTIIKDPKSKKPVIFNIGFVNDIPGAIKIGSINESENLEKFNLEIGNLKKDDLIVIYCGCCPFKDCPNIRPAFSHLTEHGFINHKLLNLPQNLKVDWINKGYPLKDK